MAGLSKKELAIWDIAGALPCLLIWLAGFIVTAMRHELIAILLCLGTILCAYWLKRGIKAILES